MKKFLTISLFLPLAVGAQQLFVSNSALVHISDGANLEVGGDLENEGVIQNLGTLSLYGDWTVNTNFNGLEGTIQFLGDENQTISPPRLTVREIVLSQGGQVNFPGDEYVVTDRIEFSFGNIQIENDTKFVLGPNARVSGGSNLSYFDGILTYQGSGDRTFPLGDDGLYAPVTLLNVFGVNTEIQAQFVRGNDVDPIPGDSLLGVSHRGLWEIELTNGGTNPTRVGVEFSDEDLSDFRIRNNIRHRVNSPVLAFSDNPEGEFIGLGVESLLDSDSLTFGTLISEKTLSPQLGEKIYLAVALAPQIPSEGLFFVPEAFSPSASDPANQTFRVFGANISPDGFNLVVYNRYGSVVYSTTSFEEANQEGWDGLNQRTGAEEPTGVYYYTLRLQFDTGLPAERKGSFFFVK